MDRSDDYRIGEISTHKQSCFEGLKRRLHCKHNLHCPTHMQLCPTLVTGIQDGDLEKVAYHLTTHNVAWFGKTAKGLQGILDIILESEKAHTKLLPLLHMLSAKGFDPEMQSSRIYEAPIECIKIIAQNYPALLKPTSTSEKNIAWKIFHLYQSKILDKTKALDILEILQTDEPFSCHEARDLISSIIRTGSLEESIKTGDEFFFGTLINTYPRQVINFLYEGHQTLREFLRSLYQQGKTVSFFDSCLKLAQKHTIRPFTSFHPIDLYIKSNDIRKFADDFTENAQCYINDLYLEDLTLAKYLQALREGNYISPDWYSEIYKILHEYCIKHGNTPESRKLTNQLNETKTKDLFEEEQKDLVHRWSLNVEEKTPSEGPEPIADEVFESVYYDEDDFSHQDKDVGALPGTAEGKRIT